MTDQTPTDNDVVFRPFAAVLHDISYGSFHDELTSHLAEVAAAVVAHRKPGKVVLTLDLKPFSAQGALEVSGSVKTSIPQPDRDPALLFATGEGVLTRNDPRQTSISFDSPVRPVPALPDTPKEA